jgi:hypothetical protein
MDNSTVYVGCRLICIVIALVCFGLSYSQAGGPDPSWRKLMSLGSTFFVASWIRWW